MDKVFSKTFPNFHDKKLDDICFKSLFRAQAPKYCPVIFKNMGKLFQDEIRIGSSKSYTLFSSDVEVDLSDFTITLSQNNKICSKTEKSQCKQDFEKVTR